MCVLFFVCFFTKLFNVSKNLIWERLKFSHQMICSLKYMITLLLVEALRGKNPLTVETFD